MAFATENKTGANCSGTDGQTGRVLTLTNTRLTVDAGFLLIVDGLILIPGASKDYTVTHQTNATTITFNNALFDDQSILVQYQYGITGVALTYGPYTSTKDVWQRLGLDAYTPVRSETIGTGNASTSTWTFSHRNAIFNTVVLYTGGASASNYTLDLDEGRITNFTASSGSVITADYDYSDVPDSVVTDFISSSDQLIESTTGRKFLEVDAVVEYLDVEPKQKEFYVRHYPVITFSSIQCNIADSVIDTPSWSSSTQGLGNDYLSNDRDLEMGRFRYIDNFPKDGYDRLKVTYNHGYASVPPMVKELSCLLATRQMMNSSVYKSIFKGNDNFTPVRLAEIENRIQEIFRTLKKTSISPI